MLSLGCPLFSEGIQRKSGSVGERRYEGGTGKNEGIGKCSEVIMQKRMKKTKPVKQYQGVYEEVSRDYC